MVLPGFFFWYKQHILIAMKKIVCICGGGSQGHISAGVIGSKGAYEVNILTRRPNDWSDELVVTDLTGKEFKTKLRRVSADPADVISESDVVLVTIPGYAVSDELERIKPYLKADALVGSIFAGSGFFFSANKILGDRFGLFGMQRVPYTGRSRIYGHTALLKGYKSCLKVAVKNADDRQEEIRQMIVDFYDTPTDLLTHYMEVSLSNSNPILHPVRMFTLFNDWTPDKRYDRIPLFYEEWNDESSALWIACDEELGEVIAKLGLTRKEIPTVLDYYGCTDVPTLTAKMSSIEPFKGVVPHLIEAEGGYILDTEHRYFIEDIPYGVVLIKAVAEKVGVATPHIDCVISWAQRVMGKEYLVDGTLKGEDVDRRLLEFTI